jgi:hypothetical protein
LADVQFEIWWLLVETSAAVVFFGLINSNGTRLGLLDVSENKLFFIS